MASAGGLGAGLVIACAVACSGNSKDAPEAPLGAPPSKEPSPHAVTFDKITLHREFYCEGASFGDFDGDGVTDVVAGPDWYEGPAFTTRHAIWPRMAFDAHGYSDCFFEFPYDFDADGALDVLVVGFPGVPAAWYQNPRSDDASWVRHDVIQGAVDNESPTFMDVTGDGVPELVHTTGGVLGYSAPDAGTSERWVFHPVSEVRSYVAFTHGLGAGDLNGDAHADFLEATGYYLAPSGAGAPYERHEQAFGSGGGQILVLDVDGDGDADVATTLAAHGYGLAWFEQTPGAEPAFARHDIVPETAPTDPSAVAMHEPHALAAADMDGDGVTDLVSGERFWGHIPPGMPDFDEPARVYWFRTERTSAGVTFTPTLIDDDSGIGTQLTAGDVNGDARPDIVVSNKKGAFVFVQR